MRCGGARPQGKLQYHVKWEGQDVEPTWENASSLIEDGCEALITEFEGQYRDSLTPRRRSRSPAPTKAKAHAPAAAAPAPASPAAVKKPAHVPAAAAVAAAPVCAAARMVALFWLRS